MSSQGFRIPRVAAAFLVLGGTSCDDKEKTSGPAGVDSSESRIRRVSKAVCEKSNTCDWDLGEEDALTESECTAQLIEDFTQGTFEEAGGTACIDAYLDLYECYVSAACEDQDDCDELLDAAYSSCDF